VRETIIQFLFAASAILVAYIYFGYPLLIALLARCVPRQTASSETADFPSVTLIVSAFNERAVIAEKLENSLVLDYPQGRLEILVVSDCSTDGTDEMVRSFAARGVRLVRQSERLGKSAGLNLGVQAASGDLLVFSDANAIYQPDAIRHLVKHFSDKRVGYVVGNARYVDASTVVSSAQSEGLYWRLETWLKKKESAFGSVVGGDGAIYAIRRPLFFPLRPSDINDLLNPLQIIAHGYTGVFEAAAVCFEEAGDSFEKEFRRKVRIVGRSLGAVCRAWIVLLPWKQPRHWFALVSHKLLRWFAPFFLLLLLASSLLLYGSVPFRLAAALQLAFYSIALAGWWLESHGRSLRVFYLPYYFCLVNVASLFGIVNLLRGSLSPTWQTVRQQSQVQQDPAPGLARRKS
jgi:cellulose synthase/poly-beta-1,6-N-acetylglucosamine synthase-like glycosyltransferase